MSPPPFYFVGQASNFFSITHCKTLLINNLQKIEIGESKTPPWHHRSIFSFTVSILTAGKLKMFWLHFVPLSWDFVSFHFLEKVAFAPFLRRSPSCRRGYCANRHFTYHILPHHVIFVILEPMHFICGTHSSESHSNF